jgi:hypothetical protein
MSFGSSMEGPLGFSINGALGESFGSFSMEGPFGSSPLGPLMLALSSLVSPFSPRKPPR